MDLKLELIKYAAEDLLNGYSEHTASDDPPDIYYKLIELKKVIENLLEDIKPFIKTVHDESAQQETIEKSNQILISINSLIK